VTNRGKDYGCNYINDSGDAGSSFYYNNSADNSTVCSDLLLSGTGMGNSDSVNLNSNINKNNKHFLSKIFYNMGTRE
jgi:hypothetical protein